MGENLQQRTQLTECVNEKQFTPWGCPGVTYVNMTIIIQTYSLKPLGKSHPLSCGASSARGNENLYT